MTAHSKTNDGGQNPRRRSRKSGIIGVVTLITLLVLLLSMRNFLSAYPAMLCVTTATEASDQAIVSVNATKSMPLSDTNADPNTASTNKRNVVVGVAFNHQNDPQRKNKRIENVMDYTALWRESILKHPNMHGVILGNMIEGNTTTVIGDRVKYVYVDPLTHPYMKAHPDALNWKINDQAYFIVREWIQENKDDLGYVLVTDVSDVAFIHDPFVFMAGTDAALGGQPQIYAGSEDVGMKNLKWFNRFWRRCVKDPQGYPKNEINFYNSGLLGAQVDRVLEFLGKMCSELEKMLDHEKGEEMCDMAAFGTTILTHYQKDVVTGYPFHNKFFSKFDPAKDREVFITHK